MTVAEQKKASKQFAIDWADSGDEKQDTQAFWITLLQKIFEVEEPEKFISFEVPVKLDHTSFIDAYKSNDFLKRVNETIQFTK